MAVHERTLLGYNLLFYSTKAFFDSDDKTFFSFPYSFRFLFLYWLIEYQDASLLLILPN